MFTKEFFTGMITGMLLVVLLGQGVVIGNTILIQREVRQLRCGLVETEVTITTQLDSLRVKIDKPVWWR